MRKEKARPALRAGIAVLLLLLLLAAGLLLGLRQFAAHARYVETDSGKNALFAGHSVLLIVPHEDDDVNVAGGVLEQYLAYGSEVRVLFVTNGDYYGNGEVRLAEALVCAARLGIPEENVLFLGYGDQWSDGGPHLYNAPDGAVLTSHAGYTAAYGLPGHPALREGAAYTRENLLADLESVLTGYRPDVILCVDRDDHIDHAAVSLAFERALGRVLRADPSYAPVVLKGFAYSTAWYAPNDFYARNALSTVCPDTLPGYYPWQARVRLPVRADVLSRSLLSSGIKDSLACYASQDAARYALRVSSGDKVFWQRRTDSLTYAAEVTATSGEAGLLTDFLLFDDADLAGGRGENAGVWRPDPADPAPSVTVTLPAAQSVDTVVLYGGGDAPLSGQLLLDDGTALPFGPDGAIAVIPVGRENVRSVTVVPDLSAGDFPGLAEIEIYAGPCPDTFDFLKLTDTDGNFLYDALIGESAELHVYASGRAGDGPLTLTCDGEGCTAQLDGGVIRVTARRGASCVLTVSDGVLSDSIRLTRGGALVGFWQGLERWLCRVSDYGIL